MSKRVFGFKEAGGVTLLDVTELCREAVKQQ